MPDVRYQGDEAASIEVEARWQFHGRWSVVAFGGAGRAWTRGDKLVTRVLGRAARSLAHGISSVANLLNPEVVVLGGGVIEALGDRFVEQIAQEVRKLPLHESTRSVRIVRAAFGDDAGISGAAIVARRRTRQV